MYIITFFSNGLLWAIILEITIQYISIDMIIRILMIS